jgi:hypothetical protein
MKMFRLSVALIGITLLLSSCSLFKPKYGCKTDGRNVGAEKLIDGTEGKKKPAKFKG